MTERYPEVFVTSENAARRHLTQSQLAHAVAGMKGYEERRATERMATNQGGANRSHPEDAGRTTEKLAKKVGVGVTTIKRAITVRGKGLQR